MAQVTARGASFHVVDLGAAGAAPVVMLHGLFTGSAASWYFTAAPALAGRHRIRLLDWRGHGLSQRTPSGYGSAAMAEDLAALTGDLPPFAIVGHSYGALVAVRFAVAHPHRVTRLALVEPPLADGAGLARLATRPAGGWPACGAIVSSASSAKPPAGKATVRALLDDTAILAELAAEPAVTDDELGKLRDTPVLAVVGSRSPFRAAAGRITRGCRRARRQTLPGGHELHVTAKRALIETLRPFLEQADG